LLLLLQSRVNQRPRHRQQMTTCWTEGRCSHGNLRHWHVAGLQGHMSCTVLG
jgi:hypothetical protein